MKDYEEIKKELLDLGFCISSIGFVYWVDAINIVHINPLELDIMNIYKNIAIQHDTLVSRVERCMRHAIEPAKNNIRKKYGYNGRISNKTYLSLIRYKLI